METGKKYITTDRDSCEEKQQNIEYHQGKKMSSTFSEHSIQQHEIYSFQCPRTIC